MHETLSLQLTNPSSHVCLRLTQFQATFAATVVTCDQSALLDREEPFLTTVVARAGQRGHKEQRRRGDPHQEPGGAPGGAKTGSGRYEPLGRSRVFQPLAGTTVYDLEIL